MSDNEPVLGIDLGTNNPVEYYKRPKIIQDELENKIIPSFNAFENEVKLIGRTYIVPNITNDKFNWIFKTKTNIYNTTICNSKETSSNITKTPKENNFAFLNREIKKYVIIVPSYRISYRKSSKLADKLVNLEMNPQKHISHLK